MASVKETIDIAYFPIRELSLKTGVNSVTLRAWERRYGLLKPKRTAKGHRLYDQQDVLRVENIVRWIQQGVAVSKVRALLDQEMTEFTSLETSVEWGQWQDELIEASFSYQTEKIEQLYQQIFSQYPAEIAARDWLFPSFEKMGKGASLAFCESVLLPCLVARVASEKKQKSQKKVDVLIVGITHSSVFSLYLAAAILMEKGVSCSVILNVSRHEDLLTLVQSFQTKCVMVFFPNEESSKLPVYMSNMHSWPSSVVLIGATAWVVAHEMSLLNADQVGVCAELLEGITEVVKRV